MNHDPLTNELPWLRWARRIQAVGQTGLTFCKDVYDRERYQQLLEIAAEIVATHTNLSAEPLLEDFQQQVGYATPKVDVRGAVVRDGKILLVQERVDERWCLPGGWADVGEIPSEMVFQEVQQESGFEVVTRKLIGLFDANRVPGKPLPLYHAYKIIFLCDIVGGSARPSHETLAVDFFPFDDLPPLSSDRTNERHLREVQAHLANPQRPAAFD